MKHQLFMFFIFLFLISFSPISTFDEDELIVASPKLKLVPKANKWSSRRQLAVRLMKDACFAYESQVWPSNFTQNPDHPSWGDLQTESGHIILHSLPTLWILNLTSQFERAQAWISKEMNITEMISLNGTSPGLDVNPSLAGLLSTYALTGREIFLEKATEVAKSVQKSLARAIEDFNLMVLLTEYHRPRLAYRYYDDLLNGSLFAELGPARLEAELVSLLNSDEVLIVWTGAKNWSLTGKEFLQRDGKEPELLQSYLEQFGKLKSSRFIKEDAKLGVAYAIEYGGDEELGIGNNPYFGLGASMGLAAHALEKSGNKSSVNARNLMQLAESWTRMSILLANATRTGLPPSRFSLNLNATSIDQLINSTEGPANFDQINDYAESLFTLWRLTGNEVYREEAWKLAQVIARYARIPGRGFVKVEDVNKVTTLKTAKVAPIQRPELFSGLLKYLYLTFSPDSVLPLDSWVFDSMGHPLPICGKHQRYARCVV